MKLGHLLSRTWALYRAHFWLFAAVTVAVWLPWDLFQAYMEQHVFGPDNFRASFKMSQLGDALVGIIASAGILVALDQIQAGGKPTFGETINSGLSLWGKMWWARVVSGFIIVLGLILLIVPGIIALVRSSLTEVVVARERLTGWPAFKRSCELTKGYFWPLLGWFIVASSIPIAAAILLGALTSIPFLDWWVPNAIASVIGGVFMIYLTIFTWVIYDELIRKIASEASTEPPLNDLPAQS